MIPDSSTATGLPVGWRTVGILDELQTRLLVGRLSDARIDHLTCADGELRFRVAVRKPDLQRSMDMRDDLRQSPAPSGLEIPYYNACCRSLISIPVGWSIGNVICRLMGVEGPLISFVACLITVAVVESIAGRVYESRDWTTVPNKTARLF